jgi:hypothetical protein
MNLVQIYVYFRDFLHTFIQLDFIRLDKPSDDLNTTAKTSSKMSILKQIVREAPSVPRIAVGILVAILLFTMFIIGFDQGHLFSLVQGQDAFDGKWIHEFTHDMRHAAGFPCH